MQQSQQTSQPKVDPKRNLNPDTLKDLQTSLYHWQHYNFGPQNNDRLLLGINEEIGELCHCVLKKMQGIRGTPAEHNNNMKDAIGDIMIYTLNYLSGLKIDMPNFVPNEAQPTNDEDKIIKATFVIVRCGAKMTEAKHAGEAARKLIAALNYFCALHHWKLEAILRETWKEVGKRDWKRYPETGLPPEGAAS